jgi:HEPN domain-containing protein
VFSSRREPADLAALYAKKASNDATAAREFADNPEISDEIIGFHAQQAVEKWLKALMANLGLPQQRTHDLTDFAVPLRYEDLLDAEPLDRRATVELVDEVGKWAGDQLNIRRFGA